MIIDPGGFRAFAYINGNLLTTINITGAYGAAQTFVTGAQNSGGSFPFVYTGGGYIDSVAIFDGILNTGNYTPASSPWVGNEPGLRHLWQFDSSLVDSAP